MKDWEKRRQERRSDYEAGKKYSKKALEILTEMPEPEEDMLVETLAAHPLHSKPEEQNVSSEQEGAGENEDLFEYSDLKYAKPDLTRKKRNGFPEVIYSPGKTTKQIVGIAREMTRRGCGNIMATRASRKNYKGVKALFPDAVYYRDARVILIQNEPIRPSGGTVLVVSAGTSDIPVSEEAAVCAEIMGNRVERLYDVGVAGIHRILDQTDALRHASVIIVVAGMEAALGTVVGGLTDAPVIGVPTSIGYGASFNGVAALLGMLNSCASGMTVVNIDNGFGAACAASKINHTALLHEQTGNEAEDSIVPTDFSEQNAKKQGRHVRNSDAVSEDAADSASDTGGSDASDIAAENSDAETGSGQQNGGAREDS